MNIIRRHGPKPLKVERALKILTWAKKNVPYWWSLDLNTDKWDAYHSRDWNNVIELMKTDGIYSQNSPTAYLAKSLPAHFRFCANEIFNKNFPIDRQVTGWGIDNER